MIYDIAKDDLKGITSHSEEKRFQQREREIIGGLIYIDRHTDHI